MAKMFPPALHSHVVHARLTSDVVDIPASDWLAQNETPVGGNMSCMFLNGGLTKDLKELFEKLSEGGKITDPYKNSRSVTAARSTTGSVCVGCSVRIRSKTAKSVEKTIIKSLANPCTPS